MKAIVSIQELLAASIFASVNESRYVLNGVCVEVKPNASPLMLATDGRRLVAIETECAQEGEFTEEYQFILPVDVVKAIHSVAKPKLKLFPWVALETKPGSKRLQVHFIGHQSVLDAENGLIEGAFPAWRQVLPSGEKTPVTELGLNAEFVGDFTKAAKFLGVTEPLIQMNIYSNTAAIEIRMGQKANFYAVLMPCKLMESIDYQPEFLGLEKPAEAKVA
jgi:hypothetical protein